MSSVTLNIEQFNTLMQKIDNLQTEVRMLNMKMDRTHYTIAEAAKAWDVSRKTVERRIKSGDVRTLDLPGRPKISIEEIIRIKNMGL